jgi:hypothetical protein
MENIFLKIFSAKEKENIDIKVFSINFLIGNNTRVAKKGPHRALF